MAAASFSSQAWAVRSVPARSLANASFSAWVFRPGPFSHCHLVPARIPLPSFTSARCSARRTLSTASPRCPATWNRSNAIFIAASGIIARVAEM